MTFSKAVEKNGDELCVAQAQKTRLGGGYPDCAVDWWCDLGLVPYFPVYTDVRSHFQILA